MFGGMSIHAGQNRPKTAEDVEAYEALARVSRVENPNDSFSIHKNLFTICFNPIRSGCIFVFFHNVNDCFRTKS